MEKRDLTELVELLGPYQEVSQAREADIKLR